MADSNPHDEFDSLSGAPMPGVDETPGDGALQQALDDARRQTDEQRTLYMRALADFENYKRRMERDARSLSEFGKRELVKKLLPVIDNLQRAAEYRDRGTPPEQIVDGVLATVKQLESILQSEGIRPIETVGKPFDPSVSEAVGTAADADAPDNTVVAEARRGYAVGDDILRPAQVIVSQHAEG